MNLMAKEIRWSVFLTQIVFIYFLRALILYYSNIVPSKVWFSFRIRFSSIQANILGAIISGEIWYSEISMFWTKFEAYY